MSKEKFIIRNIPVENLKEYKDYVNFLFVNEHDVFNICTNEDDVMKSNQWFKNFPVNSYIVSDEEIEVGDSFIAMAVNKSLNGKLFKFLGYTPGGVDLIDIRDEESGQLTTSTIHLLSPSYKLIRNANMEDKKKVVNREIKPIKVYCED
jgi:hypothetical protein